jgi:hypothetical protein
MSHMSQVQNPNGSDHFRLSQVSSQVVTGLPSGECEYPHEVRSKPNACKGMSTASHPAA